ncbi:MAG TPA: hypothetical protein VN628_01445 [Vicinamibacterales bacterium]|nr:hypothetical protein [Vicinamibacterales bacterium]
MIWCCAALVASGFSQTSAGLPARLTNAEFWSLMTTMSEPDGHFRSDNLVSNEIKYQWVIPEMQRRLKPGGVYIGVGPEQNFTYIAALRSSLAFIVDVRRGNTDMHLMYKALFELAADRADFVSLLLSRPRPAGLTAKSSAMEIFGAFSAIDPSERMLDGTLASIRNRLSTVRGFPLAGEDLTQIETILRVFYLAGTKIQYSPYGSFGGTTQPSYAELMSATDETGEARSFLADDGTFAFVKDLEQRNLIVPLIGDFAGPKTLRAIGEYARRRRAIVSAFYVSNVEEYLPGDAGRRFCANAGSLPVTPDSMFIRAVRGDTLNAAVEGFVNQLSPILDDTRRCR